MGFSINPNTYYIKTLLIIRSCVTPYHFKVAEQCIVLYDNQGDLYIDIFRESDFKPIVAHTGDYDHETAVWILKTKLKERQELYDI